MRRKHCVVGRAHRDIDAHFGREDAGFVTAALVILVGFVTGQVWNIVISTSTKSVTSWSIGKYATDRSKQYFRTATITPAVHIEDLVDCGD